ncbi:hypothetical protein PHLGIDRAFT_144051 [Phlebiopsis gigantea 11061_1 CR5-6]|uniref:Fatty acid desaturase domain-containing protein n=1 Tax=Phlebiopsis gigantea (strain 11061_1 CR5-6) TaxID=745531 RepID=A0A0C3RW15_PHLG1|nr:hypothetical protein PHLGIDRAFT_144051 [Phlebiopsis gigantea 11061_1 CR5-6]
MLPTFSPPALPVPLINPQHTTPDPPATMFSNSPEYEARLRRPFVPPRVTLKEIHDAVPGELRRKDPLRSAAYIARAVSLAVTLFTLAFNITNLSTTGFFGLVPVHSAWQVRLLQCALWTFYWLWQGFVFSSFFCLAHELGHGSLFVSWYANNIPGFILDTFILLPYFSWKATHHSHHKSVGSIEREENYVPHLRSHYKLPPPERATRADYAEMFEETPAMTLFRMAVMQTFGWWCYLTTNAMGSKYYPEGTNHFSPSSPLFSDRQRKGIIISDIGIVVMITLLLFSGYSFGWKFLFMAYVIPYMLCNHWIDPSIPHYRKAEWTFVRGVLATVDRPLLGWVGRFFFHSVSHDHIAHHFFPSVPFYNQPKITAAIRGALKSEYNYDSTNSFYALYRSFTECVFVDEDGDIVFYKNARGETARHVDEKALAALTIRPT